MRKLLRGVLRLLAVLMINKFKPGIVGVTGSVGKTSAKRAVFAVLRCYRRVRVSKGNLNNEFGFPLTILGDWSENDLNLVSRGRPPGSDRIKKAIFWFKVIVAAILKLIFYSRRAYPEVLILEYGADRPGDLKYLLEIAKPHISIVTAVGDIPVHVEFFENPEMVAREKEQLVETLPATGVAILNADDPRVLKMKDRTAAHIISYGFSSEAQLKISNFNYRLDQKKNISISFRLDYGGSFVSVNLDGLVGKGQAYAAAAGAAVGLAFGQSLIKITEALRYVKSPPHRLRLIPGIKQTTVIDDSYNAAPASMRLALETIKELKSKRKIGILGDMLEIGKYTAVAHEEAGRLAAKTVDVLVTVGPRAKFIAKAAQKNGLAKKNIFSFNKNKEAIPIVKKTLRKGDLVLVKGSRAVGLEKIVDALEIGKRINNKSE